MASGYCLLSAFSNLLTFIPSCLLLRSDLTGPEEHGLLLAEQK